MDVEKYAERMRDWHSEWMKESMTPHEHMTRSSESMNIKLMQINITDIDG